MADLLAIHCRVGSLERSVCPDSGFRTYSLPRRQIRKGSVSRDHRSLIEDERYGHRVKQLPYYHEKTPGFAGEPEKFDISGIQ